MSRVGGGNSGIRPRSRHPLTTDRQTERQIMYVKCINQRGVGNRIIEAGASVELGSVPYWPDRHGGPDQLPPDEVGLEFIIERLGVSADHYDRTLIYDEPFGYKDGDKTRPFWKLRWARFDTEAGVRVVLCTGPIYVLGDTGKTIDRTA